MSRKTTKPHAAWQWNPPPMTEAAGSIHARREVSSSTECTGLMQHVPQDESEARALCDLYGIPAVKTRGNIGKDNPRNNPEEIAFHREG